MKNEWKKAQNALIDAKMNELAECKAQLAALRAAGEQMVVQLRLWQEFGGEEDTAAAIAEWERVSK
jgi:hypothetical protein